MKPTGNHLFIAVPIPDTIKQLIHARSVQMKEQAVFKKWVHLSDYHITLTFLGGVEQVLAEQVKSAVGQISSSLIKLTLEARGIGVFGKPSSPRILWMGVEGERTALSKLQTDIERTLELLGFPPENRRYQPHITLAKNYVGEAKFDVRQLESVIVEQNLLLKWDVEEIVLYRTNLRATPMYEVVQRFALG